VLLKQHGGCLLALGGTSQVEGVCHALLAILLRILETANGTSQGEHT
jgi:hypothetical protein